MNFTVLDSSNRLGSDLENTIMEEDKESEEWNEIVTHEYSDEVRETMFTSRDTIINQGRDGSNFTLTQIGSYPNGTISGTLVGSNKYVMTDNPSAYAI